MIDQLIRSYEIIVVKTIIGKLQNILLIKNSLSALLTFPAYLNNFSKLCTSEKKQLNSIPTGNSSGKTPIPLNNNWIHIQMQICLYEILQT